MPYKDPLQQKAAQQRWYENKKNGTAGHASRTPIARAICLLCPNSVPRPNNKYCSRQCGLNQRYLDSLDAWLAGELVGYSKATGCVKPFVRRYMIDIAGGCCEQCGWNEVNPATGRVPLEVDHIDGDRRNDRPENLRVLCPNCHSLTPTYRGLNKKFIAVRRLSSER